MSESKEVGRKPFPRKSTLLGAEMPVTRARSRRVSPAKSDTIQLPPGLDDELVETVQATVKTSEDDNVTESGIQVFDVEICKKNDQNNKRPHIEVDPNDSIQSPPRRVAAVSKPINEAFSSVSPHINSSGGGPNYTDEEISKMVDSLSQKGLYTKLGSNSICGSLLTIWNSSRSLPDISPWFQNLGPLLATADSIAVINGANNLEMSYHFFTAIAGNNQRCIERQVEVVVCRDRTEIVGDYKIGFRTTMLNRPPINEIFSKFYRGSVVDTNMVHSELMISLDISRRLAQTLVPAVTVGLSKPDNNSFYAICWLLYLHRLIFLVNDMVPIFTNIINDVMEWVNIVVEDNQVGNISQRVLAAIGNHRLVIMADYFTIGEIAILRLIANGLPRFATAADSAHVVLLDDTYTPRMPLVVLGRGARPDLPVGIPSALEIQSTIIKLARLNHENLACYSGLIMACCTAMRFRRQQDNNTILDGYIQHRRSTWAMPVFRNPLVRWFNLVEEDVCDKAVLDMEHFIIGTAEDQVLRAMATSCMVAVSVSTVLHRWSMSANIIQAHHNKTGRLGLGAAIQFLDKGLSASIGSLSCSLMSSACILINDLCCVHLPSSAFSIVLWSDLLSDRVIPIANNAGWLAGWPRKVPYPVEPQAVLCLFKLWPDIWGFMSKPVVFTIDREICSISLNNESPVCISKGDDLLLEATRVGKWYPSSGYTTAVLNAISQHCVVNNWNRPQCHVLGRDGSNGPALVVEDIIPAFEYDNASLLFVVGSIWHYCWRQLLTIGVQWPRLRLTRMVQQLFSRRQTIPLTAGVESAGISDVFDFDSTVDAENSEFFEFHH